jgi:hypothetical protein
VSAPLLNNDYKKERSVYSACDIYKWLEEGKEKKSYEQVSIWRYDVHCFGDFLVIPERGLS